MRLSDERAWTCALASIVVMAGTLASARPAPAQEATPDSTTAGPVTPEQADSIRAQLLRPSAKPGFDAVDAVGLPFMILFLPVRAVGFGMAKLIGFGMQFRPQGPGLLDKLAENGILVGAATIGPRSGLAAVVRYVGVKPLFADAAFSIRLSQRYRFGVQFARGPDVITGGYQFLRNAQPHFWGIGPNTTQDNQSDYLWDQQNVALVGSTQKGLLKLNAQIAWDDNRIGIGKDSGTQNLQDVVPPGELFGLDQRLRYIRFNLGTTFNFMRAGRFNQQKGVILQLGGALFRGVDGNDSDFHSFDLSLRGFAPINPRQQLAWQLLTEITRPDSGPGVPFYQLASLGSVRGVRSLRTGRFRDFDMAALMVEWRYEVWRELHEMARTESFLFFDTGTVKDRIDNMRFDELKYSWGFGFRVVAPPSTAVTSYIAFGTEGPKFKLTLATIF